MSVRQILKANEIIAVVPDARKAPAVKLCLEGEISPWRRHLFCERIRLPRFTSTQNPPVCLARQRSLRLRHELIHGCIGLRECL